MQNDGPEWYYVIRGDKRLGPFTVEELAAGHARGEFTSEDEVQRDGSDARTNLERTIYFKRPINLTPRRNPLKKPSFSAASAPRPTKFLVAPFMADDVPRFEALVIGYWVCRILALAMIGIGLVFMPLHRGAGFLVFLNFALAAVGLWVLGHVLLCLRAIEHHTRRSAAASEWLATRQWTEIANERREGKPQEVDDGR